MPRRPVLVAFDGKEAMRSGEFVELCGKVSIRHHRSLRRSREVPLRARAQQYGMAAKRKVQPPKPRLDLPWSELTKAQQNLLYTRALQAYSNGTGPNPATKAEFDRAQAAAKA